MKTICHPNVMQLIEYSIYTDAMVIHMPRYTIDLWELLHSRPLEVTEQRLVISQLLNGVNAIHRAGYMHRDIKSANVMINEDLSLVIGDFGLAKRSVNGRLDSLPICTKGYRPPEGNVPAAGVQWIPYTNKVDSYALGRVISEVIWGGRYPNLPLCAPWHKMVDKMTLADPRSRISVAMALKSYFL